jgi:hypothetical protein
MFGSRLLRSMSFPAVDCPDEDYVPRNALPGQRSSNLIGSLLLKVQVV